MYYKELKIGKDFIKESYILVPEEPNIQEHTINLGLNTFYYDSKIINKVQTCTAPIKISKIKFKDSTKIYITTSDFHLATRKKQAWRGKKNKTYMLSKTNDGKYWFPEPGKHHCSFNYFNKLEYLFSKCENILKNIDSNFISDFNYPSSYGEYLLSRNSKLKQLPATSEVLSKIYYDPTLTDDKLKRRIRYYLNKGDTKKATNIFLRGDYPKSIRKHFLNNVDNWFLLTDNKLDFYLKNLPIDLLLNVLNQTTDKYHVSTVLNSYFECDKQFEIKTLINFCNAKLGNSHYISDMSYMYKRLKEVYSLEFPARKNENIKDYHDRLSREQRHIHNTLKNKFEKEYEKPFYSKLKRYIDPITSNIIRPVYAVSELKKIGDKLSICVGSYTRRHYLKELEIITVTDKNGKYLACLEIRNKQLVQAKLKYNRYVSSNCLLKQSVEKWCLLNNLKINTYDMQ